jgi:Flp pilus assembly protein TadG
MKIARRPRRKIGKSARRGVAAVEASILIPLFIVLFLGAMDAGQFANCYQKVSDASREGARTAARFGTTDVSSVETAVLDYLGDMFPGVSESTLSSAVQVTVRNSGGTITGSQLGSTGTGSQVDVEVSFQFDSIRWISGLQILGGWNVQATGTMRRE